LNLKYHFCKL